MRYSNWCLIGSVFFWFHLACRYFQICTQLLSRAGRKIKYRFASDDFLYTSPVGVWEYISRTVCTANVLSPTGAPYFTICTELLYIPFDLP